MIELKWYTDAEEYGQCCQRAHKLCFFSWLIYGDPKMKHKNAHLLVSYSSVELATEHCFVETEFYIGVTMKWWIPVFKYRNIKKQLIEEYGYEY